MRLAILLLVAGCDWQLHRMQEQPRCETGGTFRGESCMWMPPEGTVSMETPPTPPPVTRELVARGRNRFDTFCAPCHGIAADGNSYIARVMTLRRPPSLVDAAAASLPDDRILTVIDRGYGVVLVEDAVCSSSDAGHDALLQLFARRFSQQVAVATSEEVLDRWR